MPSSTSASVTSEPLPPKTRVVYWQAGGGGGSCEYVLHILSPSTGHQSPHIVADKVQY